MIRHGWNGDHADLTQKRQCVLAGVSRATLYAKRRPVMFVELDEVLKRLIDEAYTRHPFYGSRKMGVYLFHCGHRVNRKRVQRLMRTTHLAGMAPGLNTSAAHPRHKVYPYLLRGVPVMRANQVWSTDITSVRLGKDFACLVAVIDGHSRRVFSWRISNAMEEALRAHGKPEVFNSDQGSQFTSDTFTGALKREGIATAKAGRGRAYDSIFVERLWRSVKHEDVYLNGYSAMGELLIGLTKYFAFYNTECPHQSLGNRTPQEVHKTSSGGGAMIVGKYRTKENLPVALRSSGTAFEEVTMESESAIPIAKTGAAPSSCEKSSAS